MKKKMLFICAAGLLTASIASAIESANVVGYQKFQGVAGAFTFLAPNFIDVLPEVDQTFSLDRVMSGDFSEGDEIQFYGTDGNSAGGTLFWRKSVNYGGFLDDGWYTGGYAPATDLVMDAGQSVFILTRAATPIYIAGQVDFEDVVIWPVVGFNAIGNCTHFPLELDDIEFTDLSEGDEIQFYGPDGNSAGGTLFWRKSVNYGGFLDDGWYTGGYLPAGDTSLDPGDGIFLNVKAAGSSVTIPASL